MCVRGVFVPVCEGYLCVCEGYLYVCVCVCVCVCERGICTCV